MNYFTTHSFRKSKCVPVLVAVLAGMLIMCFSVTQVYAGFGISTDNVNSQNWGTYGSPINSYLEKDPNGNILRIEYDESKQKVIIEEYDSNYKFITRKYVSAELDTFGGYYNDGSYRYLCFGQKNENEESNFEAVRVVQYNQQWGRVNAGGFLTEVDTEGKGPLNIYEPFTTGSVNMTTSNGILYLQFAFTHCTGTDGQRHQASETLLFSTTTMRLISNEYSAEGSENSCQQAMAKDDSYIYPVMLSSGGVKGISVSKLNKDNLNADRVVLHASESTDGISIGGADTGANNVIVAGNVSENGENDGARNLHIWTVSRNDFGTDSVAEKKLTSYTNESDSSVGTPVLTKMSDNKWLVAWSVNHKHALKTGNKESSCPWYATNEINFTFIDENGNMLLPIQRMEGYLSDCRPIVNGGKAAWYTTHGKSPVFMDIDPSDFTLISHKTTITFNANGGKVTPKTQEYQYMEGSTETWEYPVPTKTDNSVFTGWYQKFNNGNNDIDIDDTLADGTPIDAYTVTLHAHWELEINDVNFPDDNFRNYISENIDKDHNGFLSEKERNNVTELDVSGLSINTLAGIEYFPELTVLNCSNNNLDSIDLTSNTKLTDLDVSKNNLEVLNVSELSDLGKLNCSDNKLRCFDLTSTAVTESENLKCENNGFNIKPFRYLICNEKLGDYEFDISKVTETNLCMFDNNGDILIQKNGDEYPTDMTYTYNVGNNLTAVFHIHADYSEMIKPVAGKEATCEEVGYELYYKSDKTGKMYSDSNGVNEITEPVVIPKKSHVLSRTSAKPATCTTDGNIEYYYCSMCKQYFSDAQGEHKISHEDTVIKASHKWDEGSVTQQPGCTTNGIKKFTCESCGEVKTEPVPPAGHKLSRVNKEDSTCSKEGHIEHWVCDNCQSLFADANGDTEIGESDIVIPKKEHTWDNGTIITPATEEQNGLIKYNCTKCSATKEEVLTATGHSLQYMEAAEPTCTKEGNIAHYKCSECGKYYSDENGNNKLNESDVIIPATGHTEGNWKTVTEPTCVTAGEKIKTCSKCGEPIVSTRTSLKKLGHKWSTTGTVTKESTCYCHGIKSYKCEHEGCESVKTEDLDMLPHTWRTFVMQPATCVTPGLQVSECSKCGETMSEEIPLVGHTKARLIEAASLTDSGFIRTYCPVCKHVMLTEYIPEIKTISVTRSTYVCGESGGPAVTVKDANGVALKQGTDYTIVTPTNNVGTHVLTVKFKNKYKGSKTFSYTVLPKNTNIKSVIAAKKAFKVKWTKQGAKMESSRITGYQIQYSLKSNFSNAKTKKVKGYKKTSLKVSGLKAKTTYYVRVRTYMTTGGKTYYGNWTSARTVKTK